MKLTPRRRYRITHQLGNQRYPRYSVMDYLGQDRLGDLHFNARPVAGTQSLMPADIIEAVEVDKDTPIVLNRRA